MLRTLICALAATMLAAGPASAASFRWTPTKAQNRVKAVYRTPDTSPGHANPPPDAVVESAKCAGVGKPVNHRYGKFHCTATMRGSGEYAGDGFHPTHKLTVTVTGSMTFRWSLGWR